jgi:eukaryotic-like serine/threonine-protein kinase
MPGADQERLARILDEYLVGIERGLPLSPEALLEKYPDDAEQLRGYLSGLQLFHAAAGVGPEQARGLLTGSMPQPMQTIGDYQLVREIGRGGMGVVYEAWQLSLKRRVALKILPFTVSHDAKQISRFKNEAQAAAQVQHPNIVPVYAIGEENGVHYYVMQLVDGQSLASLLDGLRSGVWGAHDTTAPNYPDLTRFTSNSADGVRRNSDVPKSSTASAGESAVNVAPMRSADLADHIRVVARLGIDAAEALHAAHEYGVVHRDVKPSNLLLDDQGKLWVTDFGLARCRETQGLTQTGDVLGTMRYMSPEQALGRIALIDQRTDVYSLGLTMYELATLHHPADEVSNIQSYFDHDRAPVKPLRHWNRYVPSDFQTIVLKCIAELPSERYASAKELAEDLERFLDGRPILASPPGLLSRASKWAKRRRGVVYAAAAVLLVAVVGGVVSSMMLSHERNANNEHALALTRKLLRERLDDDPLLFVDRLAAIPGAESVRQEWLERTIDSLERYEKEVADDPLLASDWAVAQSKLGILNEKRGNKKQALEAHAKAMEAWQERVSRDRSDTENVRNLALAQNNMANVVAQDGRLPEAIDLLTKARDSQAELLKTAANSRELSADLAMTHGNLAMVLNQIGKTNEAVRECDAAIYIGRRLVDESQASEAVLRSLAASYNNLGLLQSNSQPILAAEAYRNAIDTQVKLVNAKPGNLIYQSDLARMNNNLGYLASRNKDWNKAELCYTDAIQIQDTLRTISPNVVGHRRDLAMNYSNLGMAQRGQGKLEEAGTSFQKAATLYKRLLADQPSDMDTLSNQASVWNNLGALFDKQNRIADSEQAYRQAIADQRRTLESAPTNERYRALLGQYLLNSAGSFTRNAKYDSALELALERKKLWTGKPDRLFLVAKQLAVTHAAMLAGAAETELQQKCLRAAVATLDEALAAGLPKERLRDRSFAKLKESEEFRRLVEKTTASVEPSRTIRQTELSRSN